MKNLTLLLSAILICCTMQLSAQPCLPGGITFTTQAQIDSFQINYPGCTEIEGFVEIRYEVLNLDGLNILTSIGGDLWIYQTSLSNLTGLENLDSIGGNLTIQQNDLLTGMNGLNNLMTIGGSLILKSNVWFSNMAGLESLVSIDSSLIIGGNDWASGNPEMSSLSGLDNLTSIGGSIEIMYNESLSSLTSLDNVNASSIDNIKIYYNYVLANCEALGICDYLLNPNGAIEVYGNAEGCNNPWEIANSCGFLLPCLPYGNYIFSRQSDIDNFENYTDCTELEGDVTIRGMEINNLNGLSEVTSISGDLEIYDNYSLPALTGLDNLSYIGESLLIHNNADLINCSGLTNLTEIGGDLRLWGNNSLTNLIGIESLITVEGDFTISGNDNLINLVGLSSLSLIGGDLFLGAFDIGAGPLTNLEGLENLSSIGGMLNIRYNFAIINLTGLENLTSIGGGLVITANYSLLNLNGLEGLTSVGGGLYIGGQLGLGGNNSSLTSLTGLENVDAGSISSLYIVNNENLSSCKVQSICDYLAAPNGTIEIHDNAPGCSSQQQMQDACDSITFVRELIPENTFTITPNPLESTTLIEYTLKNNSPVTLKILDLSGREMETLVNEIQQKGEQRVVFNTIGLKPGIYFCVLKTDLGIQTKKIIKLN